MAPQESFFQPQMGKEGHYIKPMPQPSMSSSRLSLSTFDRLYYHQTLNSVRKSSRFKQVPDIPKDLLDYRIITYYNHAKESFPNLNDIILQKETVGIHTFRNVPPEKVLTIHDLFMELHENVNREKLLKQLAKKEIIKKKVDDEDKCTKYSTDELLTHKIHEDKHLKKFEDKNLVATPIHVHEEKQPILNKKQSIKYNIGGLKERIHSDYVSLMNSGHHSQLTNPGYSRQPEDGRWFYY